MTIMHTKIDVETDKYLLRNSQFDNSDLDIIFNSAYAFPEPYMQISKLQATSLQFFINACEINNIVEIGTFVGYSAFSMAKVLDPIAGKLTSIEINEEFYKVADNNLNSFKRDHGHSGNGIRNINLIHGDAKDILFEMKKEASKIDMIFLDGDKKNYNFYLNWAIDNLKSGGYLLIDNALFKGGVVKNEGTYANEIRSMTERLKKSNAFNYFFLPVGDCMLVAKKK